MAEEISALTPDGTSPAATHTVTRSVEVDVDASEVWRAVADPAERGRWLDDPDAASRRVRVDEATPGHRLVWTWWQPGDESEASTVTVELSPVLGGGTRVVVTEAVPALVPVARAHAAMPDARGRVRRSPSWVRCVHDRWDARLLGLELLFVATRAGVA
jgi:uncharacterized protein YndB with AHSA1/START domain